MADQQPVSQALSDNDRKRCEDLKAFFAQQEWDSVEPARMKDKKAWEKKGKELASLEIANEVGLWPFWRGDEG